MAQKIEYSDNLKKGTDKLNESIEQSNVAAQKAITAEQTANQAIQQSESTQTQLDNIVIEGDSSVEAAQARVDSKGESFPTLKSRIDNFEVSATQQLAHNSARLDDNAISPDDFSGTDFERVQASLDYALQNNVGVKFSRMYDITGHKLTINRPDLYYANDRKQLFLYGFGGGLKKNDSGFIFDAPFTNAGDINVSYLKYHSVQGAGTKVWNGDKIIRVKSHGCEYRNVDTILSAVNKYTQTMYFSSEHVTGGNGWKFEAKRFLDVVIDKCMVEDGEHFIRNTESLSIPMCNSLRITSNLIENMRGTTAILGGSYGLAITDNYIEYNGAYLDLDTLATNYPHIGLSIRGNAFYQLDSQIAARIPCIKLKNVTEASARGNGGCFSSGNSVAGSVLYDLTNMQRQSYLTGAGDFGEIINPSRYIQLGKPFIEPYPDNFARKTYGNVTNYYKQFFITLVPSGADTVLDIPLPHFTLSKYAVVNVMYDSEWFVTKKMATDASNNKIKIVFTNTHPESALNVNPRIVIEDHNLF